MSPEQISDLMNAAAVKRTITRLAHEILEKMTVPKTSSWWVSRLGASRWLIVCNP